MNEPASKIATYDDLYTLPENVIGEIIDGVLIASPRPSRGHINASSILGGEIIPPYRLGRGGPGGWVILLEAEIAFGDDILVPDLSGWKKKRFPVEEGHNWISVIPDWVCEIVSPSSAGIDRVTKMGIYARHQVSHYWIIDPIGKTLEVLKNEQARWTIIGTFRDDDTVQAEPFHEIEIDLSALWVENTFKQ